MIGLPVWHSLPFGMIKTDKKVYQEFFESVSEYFHRKLICKSGTTNMAAVASSQTKQETMYYEELDALTVKTNILSPLENEQKAVSKTKGKSHGKKKAKRKRDKAKNNANVNKQAAVPSPIGRGGATITYCRDTNKVYLLGGANRKGECFGMSTIDVFDLPTKSWSQVQAKGEVPSPRSGHTVVANGTCLVFVWWYGADTRSLFERFIRSTSFKRG